MMKVGNPADKPVVAPAAPAATSRAGDAKAAGTPVASVTTAAEPGAVEPSAQVAISSAATSLLEGSSPEFDADKVARITQAIADGKFEINAEAIADRLIANAHEVLGKVSH
jgi:negative regulator of flagellin synthesis FlgM